MTTMTTKLKTFYHSEFPHDSEYKSMSSNSSFWDLFDALDYRTNVYDVIGYDDSLIRERLFKKLAELMECDYDYIYDRWLESAD